MKWWKWLGLAGIAGVTATGVVVARAERRRRSYTPDEVRERLQQRLADAAPESTDGQASSTSADRLPGEPAHRRTSWRAKFGNRLRRAPR
ncbi:MAG: hypothetical protein ACRDO0_08430 [Nocardioidaceae bacterium]